MTVSHSPSPETADVQHIGQGQMLGAFVSIHTSLTVSQEMYGLAAYPQYVPKLYDYLVISIPKYNTLQLNKPQPFLKDF